ncbi:MAG: polysaccharide biosynthesis/export family protein [Planctomycetaceae bacterium]|nr:polysaccharide biosynthesis/export family protein [Planctomycetaceae bacterium]
MLKFTYSQRVPAVVTACMGLLSLMSVGCHAITDVHSSIPASRLPQSLSPAPKEGLAVFPFTAYGQVKPDAHLIGPGDRISVYVYGVVPAGADATPVLERTQPVNQRYYPPHGSVVGATTGLPLEVDSEGQIELPLVGKISLDGLTIPEATTKVKEIYREKQVTREDTERVLVSLITPRVHRIVVLREDTPTPTVQLVAPGQVDHIHRGSADVVDLPVYENDLLHALAITGGLPGTDAARELWIFKRSGLNDPHALCPEELLARTAAFAENETTDPQVIRIPLVACPGEELPFRPQDVILDAGDVVFVPRREEYFYVGGLVKGAKIPLPRDEDIDVIEALALANGSVGGPLGQSGTALASGTPGHMIRPTRVIILRTLPDGRQLPIRVDLARAMVNEKERILVQADDVLMFQFKPHQAVFNGALNLLNFSFLINPTANN